MLSDDEIRRRLQEDPRSIVDRGGECFVDFPGGPSFDDLEWSWERSYPVSELFKRVVAYRDRNLYGRAFRTKREAAEWYESERNGDDTTTYYDDLERSIAEKGVIDELSVADLGDGRLDMLDGWHRLALAIVRGIDTVPVFLGRLRAKNPPDPLPPPHGGTTKRVEKAAIYRHKPCEARLGRRVVWRPTFIVDVEKWKIPGKWGPQTRVRERWWSTDPETGRTYASDGPPQTPCPECRRLVSGSSITGIRNDAVPCTAKCVAAIGPSCECSCAGANHGASWGGARANPGRTAWYTGRKDDLGLRVHPWTFFDGQVGDSPIWLTPDEGFARANAGHHGFVYTVRFEPKKPFPEAPLLQFVDNYLEATPAGAEVLEALGRGEIFAELPPEDAFDVLKAIDRGDYDVMETKAMVDWLMSRGYDAMVVTAARSQPSRTSGSRTSPTPSGTSRRSRRRSRLATFSGSASRPTTSPGRTRQAAATRRRTSGSGLPSEPPRRRASTR